MANPYYVVYEYLDSQHPRYGCRFIQTFANQQAFNQRDRATEQGLIILAQGITIDSARNLYLETPLQFLMMAGINLATKNGNFDHTAYNKYVETLINMMPHRFQQSSTSFDPKTMTLSMREIVVMLCSIDVRSLYLLAIKKAINPQTGKYNHSAYVQSLKQITITGMEVICTLADKRK